MADTAYEHAMRRRAPLTDLPMFAPPVAHSRHDDPATSHAAAKSVGEISAKQWGVLRLFWLDRSSTDPEILLAYHQARRVNAVATPKQSESGLRTRRAELVAFGLVEDAGTVKGDTGRRFTKWRLTEKGRRTRGEG